MRVPYMLGFHQCKSTNAIKRMHFYYFHVYIFEFIHTSVCSLLLRCILKPVALRLGVKTLYAINQNLPGFKIRKLFLHYIVPKRLLRVNVSDQPNVWR